MLACIFDLQIGCAALFLLLRFSSRLSVLSAHAFVSTCEYLKLALGRLLASELFEGHFAETAHELCSFQRRCDENGNPWGVGKREKR